MYKSLSAADFKRHHNLPDDYRVDGLLIYGGWKKELYKTLLDKVLNKIGVEVEYETLTDFLQDVLVFKVDGKRYWFQNFYGSAMLSEITHIACLFGSEKNILLGSCGGLFPDMDTSNVLIPIWSYGEESSAKLYDRENTENKYYPNEDLSRSLSDKFGESIDVYRGPVVTCQAMLGETWEDVQNWSEQGYFGVEMESATLFAVSKHFNVPAAAMLTVADNLIKEQTVMSEQYQAGQEMRHFIRDLLFEIAVRELIFN